MTSDLNGSQRAAGSAFSLSTRLNTVLGADAGDVTGRSQRIYKRGSVASDRTRTVTPGTRRHAGRDRIEVSEARECGEISSGQLFLQMKMPKSLCQE